MAKLNGTINEVLVREGDRVKKDDILARIEDDDFRIALERAEAAYNLSKAEYGRDKSMYDKGVSPIATLDSARTAMQKARADYENAKLLLSRTAGHLAHGRHYLPHGCQDRPASAVGDPLAEILQIDRMKGVIGIPESDVTAVRRLDNVELTIQALGDKILLGRKYFLSPSPLTTARLYNLELAIRNDAGEVLDGMFVRADIVKKQVENTLAVPFYSVISRNDEQYVFIEQDGLARKRKVKLGIMEKWMVQITAGLLPGDKILVEGHRDVEDNQKVTVIKTLTSPAELPL